jgi:hypothetical protein
MPHKRSYDLVMCEPVIWRLRRSEYSFPKGSVTPTDADIHDFLEMVTAPPQRTS